MKLITFYLMKGQFGLFFHSVGAVLCVGHSLAAVPAKILNVKADIPANVDVIFQGGNRRSIGSLDFFIPAWQDNASLLFVDARLVGDSHSNKEGNLGLIYRWQIGENTVVGGGPFWDHRRSETRNTFNQFTLNAHLLTSAWQVQGNVYLASPKKKIASQALLPTNQVVPLQGYVAARQGVRVVAYERALSGADLHLSYGPPALPGVRLGIAAYHFGAKGFKTVQGWGQSLHCQMNDFVRLQVEHNRDGVRKSNLYAGITLTIPLNFRFKPKERSPIDRLFATRVIRDIDEVVGQQEQRSPAVMGTVPAIFVNPAAPAGGNGTAERPFQTQEEALYALRDRPALENHSLVIAPPPHAEHSAPSYTYIPNEAAKERVAALPPPPPPVAPVAAVHAVLPPPDVPGILVPAGPPIAAAGGGPLAIPAPPAGPVLTPPIPGVIAVPPPATSVTVATAPISTTTAVPSTTTLKPTLPPPPPPPAAVASKATTTSTTIVKGVKSFLKRKQQKSNNPPPVLPKPKPAILAAQNAGLGTAVTPVSTAVTTSASVTAPAAVSTATPSTSASASFMNPSTFPPPPPPPPVVSALGATTKTTAAIAAPISSTSTATPVPSTATAGTASKLPDHILKSIASAKANNAANPNPALAQSSADQVAAKMAARRAGIAGQNSTPVGPKKTAPPAVVPVTGVTTITAATQDQNNAAADQIRANNLQYERQMLLKNGGANLFTPPHLAIGQQIAAAAPPISTAVQAPTPVVKTNSAGIGASSPPPPPPPTAPPSGAQTPNAARGALLGQINQGVQLRRVPASTAANTTAASGSISAPPPQPPGGMLGGLRKTFNKVINKRGKK